MNYVESFNLFGVEAKEISCITGSGSPTTETEGAVGCFYMNADNGDVYKCVAVVDGVYTWVEMNESDTFTDAKYFDIDYDGIVSLKPEYRGCPTSEIYPYAVSDKGVGVDGSKIDELPEKIIVPEAINGTAVTGFQSGMFHYNLRVKEIVIPATASAIPDYFCYNAKNLVTISNAENVETLGIYAFAATRINKILLPKLKSSGKAALRDCLYLEIIDIGEIESVPEQFLIWAINLSLVKGGKKIKTIGVNAFRSTFSLKNVNFLGENVTHIGDRAFFNSRTQFDWGKLTNCTFGTYATPIKDNTTDYWSDCAYEPCENSLNTVLSQRNPAWASLKFGNSGKTYGDYGCNVLSALHIHSALSKKMYNSPKEFEADLGAINQDLLSLDPMKTESFKAFVGAFGYIVTEITETLTKENLQDIYDALKGGAYIMVGMSGTNAIDGSHAVVLYGVNGIGEMLVLDSDTGVDVFGDYNNLSLFTSQMPIQNFTGPSSNIYIVRS